MVIGLIIDKNEKTCSLVDRVKHRNTGITTNAIIIHFSYKTFRIENDLIVFDKDKYFYINDIKIF